MEYKDIKIKMIDKIEDNESKDDSIIDPTIEFEDITQICEISYITIYNYLHEFDLLNKHLQYPKMLDSMKFNSCNNNDCNENGLLCNHLRYKIGHTLYEIGINSDIIDKQRLKSIASLFYYNNSKLLSTNDKTGYKLVNNWFVSVLSYYKWINLIITDYLFQHVQFLEGLLHFYIISFTNIIL